MYKVYNYEPEIGYRQKMDKKLVKLLLALPQDDPIRIWKDRLLFSYFCKKRKIKSDEERKKYFLERIVKVVPGLNKESDDLLNKLSAYGEWQYKPFFETLDGNKLLEFLKQHNIDLYLFIYTYGSMLDFSDLKYGLTCKRKGYRKLFNLYREAQRNIFGEAFMGGWPKFEDDEDEL